MDKRNASLKRAKREKNDEFYTLLIDIEKEMAHYKEQFNGKCVYSNCDDYRYSNFKRYFVDNFKELNLKRYICTCKGIGEGSYLYDYDGVTENITAIEGNGDFRSKECIELLKECDVVVTNPPFSLFREYVSHLMKYGKKFIIIGNINAVTYKEIFPLIKENKVWMGATCFNGGATHFIAPSELYDAEKMSNPKNAYFENGKFMWRVNGVRWFTNVEHNKRHIPIDLYKKYSPESYPKYDNYDAIEVSKFADTPMDYDGVMGVPISMVDKYCPTQFEILGIANNVRWIGDFPCLTIINGEKVYNRILIRRKKAEPIVEAETIDNK